MSLPQQRSRATWTFIRMDIAFSQPGAKLMEEADRISAPIFGIVHVQAHRLPRPHLKHSQELLVAPGELREYQRANVGYDRLICGRKQTPTILTSLTRAHIQHAGERVLHGWFWKEEDTQGSTRRWPHVTEAAQLQGYP